MSVPTPKISVPTERDVLDLVGDVLGALTIDEFQQRLMAALREKIPSDFAALNEVPGDVPDAISVTDPVLAPWAHKAFARIGHTNPIAMHFLATGDGQATRISDLISAREYHELPIYREIYMKIGVEYQIAWTLPSQTGRVLGAVLSRHDHDFSDAERDLLNLARPYLIEVYRNVLAIRALQNPERGPAAQQLMAALGVTRRQAEILALIATGHTAPAAAATLGITARTAQKHLQLAYRKLGVSDRSAASRKVWATIRGG